MGGGGGGGGGALTTQRSAVKQLHIRGVWGHPLPPRNFLIIQSLMIESGGPWSTNSSAVIYKQILFDSIFYAHDRACEII